MYVTNNEIWANLQGSLSLLISVFAALYARKLSHPSKVSTWCHVYQYLSISRFENHESDLKKKMSKMSKETEDDNKKIDISSDCQDANNTCLLPLVILLLHIASRLY